MDRRAEIRRKVDARMLTLMNKAMRRTVNQANPTFGVVVINRPMYPVERRRLCAFLDDLNADHAGKNTAGGVAPLRCEYATKGMDEVDWFFNKRYERFYVKYEDEASAQVGDVTIPSETPAAQVEAVQQQHQQHQSTPLLGKRSCPEEDASSSMFGVKKVRAAPVQQELPASRSETKSVEQQLSVNTVVPASESRSEPNVPPASRGAPERSTDSISDSDQDSDVLEEIYSGSDGYDSELEK